MLRNHLDEDYLKGFLPGLENYLWTGEEDYSKQKEKANQIVFNDLILKGLNLKQLSPELILRTTGTTISATVSTTAITETNNNLRWVVDNATPLVAGSVLTLKGSDDNSTFYDVATITMLVGDTTSTSLITGLYKYYKITTTINAGTIDYRSYLVETKYDLLFAYKWIELILRDAKTVDGDQYHIKELDFKSDYNSLLNSGLYAMDTNSDGIADTLQGANIITFTR